MKDNLDRDNNSNWRYSSGNDSKFEGEHLDNHPGVPLQEIPTVKWTASEYIAHEKNSSWYLIFIGSIGLLVAVIYLITKDILASTVILLTGIIMGIYAKRKPTSKQYEISESGIKIDGKYYPHRTFKSFSVVKEGAIESVWIRPIKRIAPVVIMYYPPEDGQKIIDILSNFLPHEQRELDVVDKLSKKMRF